jgi:hypothetical protein
MVLDACCRKQATWNYETGVSYRGSFGLEISLIPTHTIDKMRIIIIFSNYNTYR